MEPPISSSLGYFLTNKEVRDRAKEMFSGLGNLRYTYDFHRAFFSLSLDDMSQKAFHCKFHSICEEINLSAPHSLD